MPTIMVEPDLYEQIEEAATARQTSPGDIFAEAIRHYLWELARHRISEESAVYRQRHPDLRARYLGQFIAMHNGRVVDHDSSFRTLRRRIRERFGQTAVMITKVEEEPISTLGGDTHSGAGCLFYGPDS